MSGPEADPIPPPTSSRPLPLWPVVVGPILGVVGARLIPARPPWALGYGAGMFVGLLACLGTLLGRRQLGPEALLVAVAALIVLASLVGRPWP